MTDDQPDRDRRPTATLVQDPVRPPVGRRRRMVVRGNGGSPRGSAATGPPSSAASTVVPDVIEALLRVYAARDKEEEQEVRRFLAEHPELLALLVEAPTRIPSEVANGHPLGVDLLLDPEDGSADGVLFIVVPTRLPLEQAESYMKDLIRDWLLEASRRSQGRFNVTWQYM